MSGGRTHPHEGAVFQQRADKAFVHQFSSPWVEYRGTLSWQRFSTAHNFTTALASLYCGTSTRLAFVLCKSCGVLKRRGMQSTEHCTGGLHCIGTKL